MQKFLKTNSEIRPNLVLTVSELQCWASVSFGHSLTNLLIQAACPDQAIYWLWHLLFQETSFSQSWGNISHLVLCSKFPITVFCKAKQTSLTLLPYPSYYGINKNCVAHVKTSRLAQTAIVEATTLIRICLQSCQCARCVSTAVGKFS